jgi:hypothetical protein
MNDDRNSRCPSFLVLDSYLLDVLESADRQDFEAHIKTCATCQERLTEADKPHTEVVNRILAAGLRDERPESPPFRWRWWTAWAGAAAVTATLFFFAGPQTRQPQTSPTIDQPQSIPVQRQRTSEIRLKGSPVSLLIYRQTPDGSKLVLPDTVLNTNDRVQFAVSATTRGFAAVFGINGEQVSRYVPLENGPAVTITGNQEEPIEPAWELDRDGVNEQFQLLFCPAPFTLENAPETASELLYWLPQPDCRFISAQKPESVSSAP